ncbi:carbonic anhydrase 2 [Lucilia cuprina]|uniref:carbonic anhydrase 2 n=1 Tax=Lucilia cuprina TaxID=7375 RepID=UPI001F06EDB0|nr:carbonic anhydrase 2 [Lucilia cuprina]
MVAANQTVQKLFLLLPLAYPPVGRAPDSAIDWSYENPQSWGINSPQCNGNRQSPIHIRSTTSYILPIAPIRFGNYDVPLSTNLNLTNNGHSVEYTVPLTTNGQRPYITGGLLRNRYEAMAVHFHWGSATTKGSEHVIDNRRFDVEMHIVHKNVQYATMEQAARNRDGLAVLGVMFKIVNVPDRLYPGLNRIFNQLPVIVNYQSSVSVTGRLSLGQMLGDLNTKQFFTYSGSLTTPNCAESVTWHVFPGALPIAREQIQKFWSLLDVNGNVLNNNFRPLQNRNRRPVFYRIAGRTSG